MAIKKITLFYTGGTIGMVDTPQGLMPDFGLPEKIQQHFSGSLNNVELSFCSSKQPIDSSHITPQHWVEWIEQIRQILPHTDAVIVLHGTDTMAYTAALFSLVFAHTNQAIVFTGSQKAWVEKNSDAPDNLLSAISLIQQGFSSVGLVFHQTLFDPADCRKVSTENNQAFSSIWQKPWGELKNNQWHFYRLPEKPVLPQKFNQINTQLNIKTIYLNPLFDLSQASLFENCDGVILLTYGNGNIPNNQAFLHNAKNFCQQNKPLIILSQVWQGEVNNRYASNYELTQIGAINGGKNTPETALAKLFLALSAKMSIEKIAHYFQAA